MSSRRVVIKKKKKENKIKIGIIIPVTSRKRNYRNVENIDFFKILFSSFLRTYNKTGNYEYLFYLGHDDDDAFFIENKEKILEHFNSIKSDNMKLFLEKMVDMKNNTGRLWSRLGEIAKQDCEYLYQLGDDIDLISSGWEDVFIKKLSETNNIGATGPNDINTPRNLLTQCFVHITHLKIFETFFPKETKNWYTDDWITEVYNSGHIENITVRNCGGNPRYQIDNNKGRYLEGLKRDKEILERYKDSHKKRKNNIVSFSLYGGDERYTKNALINSEKILEVYPDWKMRVYYDSTVPLEIIKELSEKEHVELVNMEGSIFTNKMLWRFTILLDEKVDAFIIRDIDSHLSLREKECVDEWLKSDKKFHVLRDHPSHCNYPISGGMWGGKFDKNLSDIFENNFKRYNKNSYLLDMNLLNICFWKYMKDKVLVFDSFQFNKHDAECRPFPSKRKGLESVGSVVINGKDRECDVEILKNHIHLEKSI